MAVPVLGGLLISDEVVDIFLPVRFYWVRRARWLKHQEVNAKAAREKGEMAGPAVSTGQEPAGQLSGKVEPR
jgi:Cu(I)/Ag(I) efflux system membrane protein CusA/SilA